MRVVATGVAMLLVALSSVVLVGRIAQGDWLLVGLWGLGVVVQAIVFARILVRNRRRR